MQEKYDNLVRVVYSAEISNPYQTKDLFYEVKYRKNQQDTKQ